MKKILLVLMYVFLTIAGLVLMKCGKNTGSVAIEQGSILFSINWISLLGLISYILSFLLFTRIVVKFNLSFIVPITAGIVQVLTLVFGIILFNETISVLSIIGVFLVICGIVLMNIKISKEDNAKSIKGE